MTTSLNTARGYVIYEGAARAGVLVCIAVVPWLIGGIPPSVQHGLAAACAAICGLLLVGLLSRGMSGPPVLLSRLLLPAALLFGLAAFQLVDLGWYAQYDSPSDGPNWLLRNHGPISVYPAETRMLLARWALGLTMFVAGMILFATPASQLWLWSVLAVNGVALSFFGLVQKLNFNGKLYWTYEIPAGGEPCFSSFVNRNQAAGFLNLCLAGVIGLVIRKWARAGGSSDSGHGSQRASRSSRSSSRGSRSSSSRRGSRSASKSEGGVLRAIGALSASQMAAAVAAVAIVVGVMSSLSRAGIVSCLAAIVACLAHWMWTRRSHGALLLGLVLVASSFAVLVWLGVDRELLARFRGTSTDTVLRDARVAIIRDSWPALLDRPLFGSGLGTFHYMFQAYQSFDHEYWFYNADNQFLETAFELGFVGIGILLAAMAMFGVAVWVLLRARVIVETDGVGFVGLFVLVALGLHAFFDFGVIRPANLMLWSLLVGSVSARAAAVVRPTGWPAQFVSLPPMRAPLVAVTIVLVCGINCVAAWAEFGRFEKARDAVSRFRDVGGLEYPDDLSLEETETLLADLNAVAEIRPDDAEVHRAIGALLCHRYSLGVYEALVAAKDASNVNPMTIWKVSGTATLHLQSNALVQDGDVETVKKRLAAPIVQQNLPQARMRYLRAIRCCPVISLTYIRLAELAAIRDPSHPDGRTSIYTEIIRSRDDPGVQFNAGLLAANAGDFSLMSLAFRNSLTLSDLATDDILEFCRTRVAFDQQIENVFPRDPEFLLGLAENQFASQPRLASQLATRSLELLEAEGGDSSDYKSVLVRGRAAAIAGDWAAAAKYLQQAIAIDPMEADLHARLSTAWERQGDLDAAFRSMGICVALQPANAAARERYEQLNRQIVRRSAKE